MDVMHQDFRSAEMAELAQRLNSLLKDRPFRAIKVFPTELVGDRTWRETGTNGERAQREFNERLGTLAMPYLRAELVNTVVAMQWATEERLKAGKTHQQPCLVQKNPHFKIGLGTGSTIHKLVESWIPIESPLPIQVLPMAIGPVPEDRYSAGFVSSLLQSRIDYDTPESKSKASTGPQGKPERADNNTPAGKTDLPPLVSYTYDWPSRKGVNLQITPEFLKLRDGFIDGNKQVGETLSELLNWVVTGIGESNSGQSLAHQEKIFKERLDPAVGDICSIFFNQQGEPVGGTATEVARCYSAITFDVLQNMCLVRGKAKRVIAIAGGRIKYLPILSLLKRKTPVFNVLVTDELTVRRLLMDLANSTRG